MHAEQLTYTIAGLSPLLLNNPRGMLAQGGAAPSRQKRIPSPEEEAEGGAYRTAEGVIAVPAIAVRNAMITAAAGFKYKTRSWKGFVSHVEIRPAELLPLFDSHGEPVTDYEIDLRRAVIKGRGAVARARPLIRDWRATFTFVADTTMLPHDRPRELLAGFLADAGARIGIGDYRPEKTGWFGRFSVLE
ncbi:MAG TPA: hypothetical protein VF668_19725 [Pyrinomonadaceae bacterium]